MAKTTCSTNQYFQTNGCDPFPFYSWLLNVLKDYCVIHLCCHLLHSHNFFPPLNCHWDVRAHKSLMLKWKRCWNLGLKAFKRVCNISSCSFLQGMRQKPHFHGIISSRKSIWNLLSSSALSISHQTNVSQYCLFFKHYQFIFIWEVFIGYRFCYSCCLK